MGDHWLFEALLLCGLLWFSLLLDWMWLRERLAPCQTTSTLARPIKRRSKDPKPFPGLTHKPHCDTCAHGQKPAPQAPPCPPPLPASPCGRRREVDTQQHFCPNPHCTYSGWVGRGNIRANGHPGAGPWRQLQCTACRRYFQETHGTPLHGKRVPPERLVWAVGALAEGLGIRAVARVFEVDPNTVLTWLIEVADHAAAFSRHFLHDVRVTQVQLDELFALLSAVKAGKVSETEAIQHLARSPHWVWGAIDPVTKLLLTIDVGERTLAKAQRVVHQIVQVLAPDCAPLFLTDGFKEYTTALLTHYGQWVQPPRKRIQGPVPKSRWMPRPALL
jgi:transposase-like protein